MFQEPNSRSRRHFLETAIAGGVALCLAGARGVVHAETTQRTEIQEMPARVFDIVYEMMPTQERLPILDWIAKGGWCKRISCRPEVTDAMLEEVEKRGWSAIVTMLAHPGTRARQWTGWNLPVPDVDAVIARYKRIFDGNFAWEVFTEDDSAGVAFPQVLLREQPKTYDAAKALFDTYVTEAMDVANRHRDVERWGRPGYASGVHPLAAQGLDCIMVERANDDVEDLLTGIAFARGAARQFGCRWGIDFSLWWGVIFGCVQDLPALFHKRNLYMTYFAGADAVSLEGGDLLYDLEQGKPRLLGQTLEEFGRFTRTAPRGEVETPVAVLLPDGHGWITPPYWRTTREAWNYARIPYRQGYRGVDAFFAMAYPGSRDAMDPFPFGRYGSEDVPASPFALSCVTPEFAPRPENVYAAEPPLPFGRYADRDQAREDFYQRTLETSPYRPMGNTRWGDVIDVLTTSASEHVLGQYKVVVLLGPVSLDSPLKARLETYVTQGGTLILAAGVAGPSDSGLCGVEIQPELLAGAAWCWEDEPFMQEAFRYCPAHAAPGVNLRVLGRVPNGQPLITRHATGLGCVYTCLAPWFEGGDAMAGAAARLFDEVIGAVQPVTIQGLPIHWTTSKRNGETVVALANNNDIEWKGRVRVQVPDARSMHCRELCTGESITPRQEGSHLVCDVVIPSFDVRVLSCAEV